MTKEQYGASQAESLLEDIGFDCLPISPQAVVAHISDDAFRVEMHYVPFSSENILGQAQGNDSAAVIAINDRIRDKGRRNFTAAHEIGHVCLHIMAGKKPAFECAKDMFSSQYDDPYEREANGFASGLLMPRGLISKVSSLDINWREVQSLVNVCDTSREVTLRRLFALKPRMPYAFVIHQNKQFKRFVKSDSFEFYVDRSPLSDRQLAACRDGKGSDLPEDLGLVDAVDWVVPKSKYSEISEIYASSICLDDGFVYTLLHYDDDCLVEAEEE